MTALEHKKCVVSKAIEGDSRAPISCKILRDSFSSDGGSIGPKQTVTPVRMLEQSTPSHESPNQLTPLYASDIG